MPVLEVKDIKKSYGQLEVLKGISFSMEQGEVLAVIGSSGGGKTTLLRCLTFLEKIDSGSIIIGGEEIISSKLETVKRGKDKGSQKLVAVYPRDEILRIKSLSTSLVFQDFNLFPHYNVLKNLTLAPMMINKASEAEANALAMKMLQKVGLSDKANYYPHQLSGGQKQRVAIARALCMSPQILCFDEPTSALDPELTVEVLKVIASLKQQGVTMLIVTHEINFAHDIADKAIFLDKGYIIEEGDAKELIDNPKTERAKEFLSKISNVSSTDGAIEDSSDEVKLETPKRGIKFLIEQFKKFLKK